MRAPERARGQAPAPPSDLWSLGATLFTAVEGRPPFDGGEPLLVQVGFTRFALRISEAKRVVVDAAIQERRA